MKRVVAIGNVSDLVRFVFADRYEIIADRIVIIQHNLRDPRLIAIVFHCGLVQNAAHPIWLSKHHFCPIAKHIMHQLCQSVLIDLRHQTGADGDVIKLGIGLIDKALQGDLLKHGQSLLKPVWGKKLIGVCTKVGFPTGSPKIGETGHKSGFHIEYFAVAA